MRETWIGALMIGALAAAPSGLGATGPETARVAIVRGSSAGPFTEATTTLIAALRARRPEPEILTFDLEGDPSAAASTLDRVRESTPSVVVSVGSLATSAVLEADPPLAAPIVFSMVLYPAASGFLRGPRPLTGASLDIPFEVQFAYLRRLLPQARRVGVLFSPAETGSVIAAARPIAQRHGLELLSEPVDEPSRAPLVLESLIEKVDVLWTVADGGVFTPQTTPLLLLSALRHRIPMLGLSPGQVRSGALAALIVDYEEVGRQTAAIAAGVLDGRPLDEIPVTRPERVALALNLRTAELLDLQVARDLVDEAAIVVR